MATLSDLSGVNESDGAERGAGQGHAAPRLGFSPRHALIAMLLLLAALSASLTMLIKQSFTLAQLQSGVPAASAHRDAERAKDATDADSEAGGNGEDTGDTGSDGTADGSVNDGNTGNAGNVGNDGTERGSGQGADAPNPAPTSPLPRSPTESDDGLVDLNTATLAELDTITGVGPVLAQRIIDHRTQIGRFSNVDELLDVKGIGAKTLEKLRPQVTVR